MSVSADVADQGTAKVQNTTVWVNGFLVGSCTTSVQPQQHSTCKVGKDVPCESLGSAPPYTVKVTVAFHDGSTYSSTGQATGQIAATC